MNADPARPARGFDADAYAANLGAESGFEAVCSRARQNYNLRQLRRHGSRQILEIGCGDDLLFERAIAEGVDFDSWVVVEPARALAHHCRERARTEPRLMVIEMFCEDLAASPKTRPLPEFDTVLVSSVLQHSNDPVATLAAATGLGGPGARVLVTTPNAGSFHRLLAVEMGLVETIYSLKGRNDLFQHIQVFDPERLRELMLGCGIRDLEFEGYVFKPFTHGQMEKILPLLPTRAPEGLEELGRRFPANAAEIAFSGIKG